ncbi:MAG: DNA primase [Tepidisphaeraceae bacterium]
MASNGSTNSSGLDGKTLVLQAVDLVQLIGQTVALKKAGKRYTGLCPFHNEKSPSFGVDPDKGYYHCFGCKKGGNAIDFVMERDHVDFKTALYQLAEQYKVELPRGGPSREGAGLKQQLLDACSAAATFFEQNLNGPAGQVARDYLTKRGFTDETIRRFRLGVAPDGWGNLVQSPLMKKFRPEVLVQAGLLKVKEDGGRPYDVFRNRLMFPIRDEAGRVVAFGGRVLPGNDSPAKYLNSPETPLFSKSKIAYGLDLARPKVVETKTVAIVEGYTDVVMAHQFGASNVVATLGTAMTEQHVNLLRRFAGRIVLLFDGDAAGDLAVQRALELFLTQPIDIGIATLPDGVDPDEFLLQHGTAAFDDMLAKGEDALSFQWKRMTRQFKANQDLTAQRGRSKTSSARSPRRGARGRSTRSAGAVFWFG